MKNILIIGGDMRFITVANMFSEDGFDVAVYGFKRAKSTTVKILALFFGVVVFVVCGLEHCVADMFYFTFSNLLGSGVFLPLLIIVLGNIVGGLFIPVCSWVYKKIR